MPNAADSDTDAPAPTPTPTVHTDDPKATVPAGTRCRRKGCGHVWDGQDGARRDSEGPVDDRERCTFHPGSPIFHEGSKGYSCCRPRVLDFNDFLNLPGCSVGSHQFVAAAKDRAAGDGDAEGKRGCRLDHYQTPGEVVMDVFVKRVNPTLSQIKINPTSIDLDLVLSLPQSQSQSQSQSSSTSTSQSTSTSISTSKIRQSILLHAQIDPVHSTYRVLGTKIEFTLKKARPGNWLALTRPSGGEGGYDPDPDPQSSPDDPIREEGPVPVPVKPKQAGKGPVTCHVLDSVKGKPAVGVVVELSHLQPDGQGEGQGQGQGQGGGFRSLASGETDGDGRCSTLLEPGTVLPIGVYKMRFGTGDYFAGDGRGTFYPFVEVVFHYEEPESHYHIPLLLSQYSYTTYRGS